MSDWINNPFNPPFFDVEYSRIDFVLEYEEMREAVASACLEHGFGESDCAISVEAPSPPSRLIQLSIQSEEAWRPDLIPTLIEAIAGHTTEYAIWLSHGVLSLPFCSVFIRKDGVLAQGDRKVLERAGFLIPDE